MARALSVQVLETQTINVLSDVLQSEQVCLVAVLGHVRCSVFFAWIQIPVCMGEAHNPIIVRVATGRQTGPAWATLWSSTESAIEPGTFCR
jgi:hypothetical protein